MEATHDNVAIETTVPRTLPAGFAARDRGGRPAEFKEWRPQPSRGLPPGAAKRHAQLNRKSARRPLTKRACPISSADIAAKTPFVPITITGGVLADEAMELFAK